MANTLSFSPAAAGAVQPIIRQPGIIPFALASTETYATATGGIVLGLTELNLLLASVGIELQVKPSDIVAIIGNSATFHRVIATRQSDFTWKIRLMNGTSEIVDGALVGTTTGLITGLMFFSPGSPS